MKQKFKKLKRSEQAIAIAEDVIKQIRRKAYDVTNGTYTTLRLGALPRESQVQDVIKRAVTPQNPCEVCAIGSAFLSAVKLFNNCTVAQTRATHSFLDTPEPANMRRLLSTYMPLADVWALEICFEEDPEFVGYKDGLLLEEWERNELFRDFLAALSPAPKLIWLMQVIIDNYGRFTIPAAKDAALITLATDVSWAEFRREHQLFC